MSLFKRGNVWHCNISIKGQKPYRGTCDTGDRQAAERREQEIIKEIQSKFKHFVGGQVGFVALAELDVARARRNQNRPDERNLESTVIGHWRRLCEFFEPGLDNSGKPALLRVADLEKYIEHRKKRAKPQTYKRELEALRRGLDLGVREHKFEPPIRDRDWPRLKPAPKNEKRRGKLRSRDLIDAWHNLLDGECQDENIFVGWTAVRKEECFRTCREMLQPTNNSELPGLLILPAWATKTNVGRTVGLLPPAWAAIQRQLARNVTRIIIRDGREYHAIFSGTNYKKQMEAASKKLGLVENLTRRDLRHSFLTHALEAGADKKAVMSAGGHATVAAMDMYQSSTPEREAAAALALYRAYTKTRP